MCPLTWTVLGELACQHGRNSITARSKSSVVAAKILMVNALSWYLLRRKALAGLERYCCQKFVAAMLRARRARRAEDRLAAGPDWVDLDLVFSTRKGTPIEPRRLDSEFKRALRKANLPDTTRTRLHDSRRFAASLLPAQGGSSAYRDGDPGSQRYQSHHEHLEPCNVSFDARGRPQDKMPFWAVNNGRRSAHVCPWRSKPAGSTTRRSSGAPTSDSRADNRVRRHIYGTPVPRRVAADALVH